jgi:methylamine dehydrogenase accessory protein MauD
MDTALLIARLLLAAVFGVAGVAKLADRAGSRQALIGFGVPRALASPLGLLLPLAELAVSVALVSTASAWWGAVGALTLLLLFVAGIGLNLAQGRTPDCHCFGQLRSAPAGWSTLGRNAIFAAVAGFVVWQGRESPGPSIVGWVGALTTGERAVLGTLVFALGLLAAEAWLLLQILRQNGRLVLRIEALEGTGPSASVPRQEGLPVGAPAPTFRLAGLQGEERTLDDLRAPGKPAILIFSDPGCGPCTALLPEIGRWQREHAEKATIVLVSRGALDTNRAMAAEHALTEVLLQRDREVSKAYKVFGTPSAVLVHPNGAIGSPVAAGADEIRSLVDHVAGPLGARPWAAPRPVPTVNGHVHEPSPGGRPVALKAGEAAPRIALPDLEGRTIHLADFGGRNTLVLFWNPDCGFCQQMLPDLKAWESRPPKGAPNLLVVSTGTVEANRAQGFRSPIVLDKDFATLRAYGADGTPSAVLVDAQGRIASDVALGDAAILALARARRGRTAGTLPAPAFGFL